MQNQNNQQNQPLQKSDPGRLQVSVFSESVGSPVDNAKIRVSRRSETSPIEQLISDTSGLAPIVELPAPPFDYSQAPGEPKPYAEYDIYIEADGFEPLFIEGTQILPSATALQPATLSPIEAGEHAESINIKPHTLWGHFPPKIPEDEVKELPPSLGFVVLPDPVIPEFIIVHEGVPSDRSARNVYVPFKDYIKNVASCEVYSTWPISALTANILAIISFTMNRVYTEWYRGKGMDFTITNSTAFDQAYVHGRNIFEEISRLVDDLFTNFITRPGIRQPLLTQYCDGTRVSCPGWLSQWGSKQLSDSGYNAASILRNYYGQDIFLMQAQKVSGVPVSFPGTPLQVGSSGQFVRMIQEQLNAISNNYPAIEKIRVDGIFGENTLAAVEKFQQIFGLPATGIVDFATWYQISNIFVAVERLAEL